MCNMLAYNSLNSTKLFDFIELTILIFMAYRGR